MGKLSGIAQECVRHQRLITHDGIQLAFGQAHVNARSGRSGGSVLEDSRRIGNDGVAALQNLERAERVELGIELVERAAASRQAPADGFDRE